MRKSPHDVPRGNVDIFGFPSPSALVTDSVLDHFDDYMRRFISLSPLCFISSCSAGDVQEVSPRGEPPGSFRILNDRPLAIADRPGEYQIARSDLPSFTTMIADQAKLAIDKRAAFEVRIAKANVEGLWESK